MEYSYDQAQARDRIAEVLKSAGIDLDAETTLPGSDAEIPTLAVIGKAGSGKTKLLADLVQDILSLGVEVVSGDFESKRSRSKRTLAVLAPTNKAASVLRQRGVPATTIHRVLYTPVYDPDYEAIAEWLVGKAERPKPDKLDDTALDRAKSFYDEVGSIPGALAAVGVRGSDFIQGWKLRDEPLDIGMIDEASMLDGRQFEDLRGLFKVLVLFGDPAQLAPVGQNSQMVFDTLPQDAQLTLSRIHRQSADNPILDLAHALSDPDITFEQFEAHIEAAASNDDRVVLSGRVDADIMARAPVLVWRNATRIRLINAFRAAHGAPPDMLLPGEPLICDGVELPLKHRKKRMDLEARGLIKGAQVVYLGVGRKPGFARLHVMGAPDPRLGVASIIQIEAPDQEEPFLPLAASMGAVFLHGAAVTIHKGQGSQWPEVQVFAPDIYAAARSGRIEAGIPLWKRLAYVAITRAEERLLWVRRYALGRPRSVLGTSDLEAAAKPEEFTLEATQ